MRAVPAVFVGYDLADSLAMENTVRAPGSPRFDVFAYHQPTPLPMPEIAGLKLWVSYDGEQWTQARVRAKGDGRYEANLLHPVERRGAARTGSASGSKRGMRTGTGSSRSPGTRSR